MKTKKKLLSIITVVKNDVTNIELTIKSILSQRNPNVEYIIIDGKSSDGTDKIIRKYKKKISKIVISKDKGIYDAMNKGIALAKGFTLTGLSEWLGSQLALLGDSSQAVFVGSAALAATFGTEVISNTALSNIAMPILALTAQKIQIDPRVLLVPCALACSCAFMMPAATGPNAIIFGTGRIRIWDMVRVGFWINLIAWGVITSVSLFVYG